MVNNLGIIQLAILASCLMADDRPVSLDDRFTVDGCYRAAREKSQREREAKLKAAQRVQTAEERKQTQDRQAVCRSGPSSIRYTRYSGAIECNDFDAMMRCLIKHTATLDQTRNDIAKAKKLLAINQKFQRAAGSIVSWRFIISSITPSDGTNPARVHVHGRMNYQNILYCTFPENTEPAATGQGVVSADFSTPTGERPSRARRGSPR